MQLVVITYVISLSYWLNLRVLLCATWVLTSMVIASFIIWKFESPYHSKPERGETQQDISQFSRDDEAWKTCVKEIHPIWLLAYRVIAFCFLLTTLIVKVSVNGAGIFYYYTQWTFTLVTIYFGFGSLLSIYGYYQYYKISRGFNVHCVEIDAEQGSYLPLLYGETTNTVRMRKISDPREEKYVLHASGILGYVFQVIFQMTVNMHTLNAIALLGDAALNCLRFLWFRISYFVLWTGIFVIFQWIVHACVSIWWPYPFLDLSSPYAPLWYFLVAMMHIPCYGIFALIVEIKHYLLSKWFPQSYQCSR